MNTDAPGDLRIRPIRADEAAALQSFYNGLSEDTRVLFRPLDWHATIEVCTDVVEKAAEGLRYDIVLEAEGTIVGWAFLAAMDRPAPHLGVAVADHLVGQGYGRKLMADLVAEAERAGKEAITLIFIKTNDRARRLYESFGFKITGEDSADGQDYYKMRVELA